jgi:hypothetical protein
MLSDKVEPYVDCVDCYIEQTETYSTGPDPTRQPTTLGRD